MIGQRLFRARKAAGLSLRELAQRTGLSHTAISKFEQERLTPSSRQLIELAKTLGVRGEFFFRPMQAEIAGVEYRKKASMPQRLLDRVHGDVLDQAERWQELLSLYPDSPIEAFSVPPDPIGEIREEGQIEALAEALRHAWSLGTNPIPDLIDTLESKGIRVITTDADDQGKLDGLAGQVDGVPLVVVGRHWPGDRQRFTLAHEFGHLILAGRVAPPPPRVESHASHRRRDPLERQCNRFAGAFLLPRQAVVGHLGAQRRQLEPNELLLLKHEYGLSMQACLFRALDANVIDAATHQAQLRLFGERGWRKQEPGVPYPPEETILFKQLVFRALGEELVGESKAAELLGVPLAQFHRERKLEAAGAAPH
jgi:Zn-dependent peptidase ImmA (M78 family)/transcriptional regulator with XRE-family HTH domain